MSPVPALLRFVVGSAPVAALVFLWVCDFFVGWDGQAVSTRPQRGEDPATVTVLIAEPDAAFEREWPYELVQKLGLPVDASGIPPMEIPPERPATTKRRFTLHFLVDSSEGFRVSGTTSPQKLGLGLLVWVALILLRNMRVGGAPWAIAPREVYLPEALPTPGQITASGPGARPKKTHPSSRRGRR